MPQASTVGIAAGVDGQDGEVPQESVETDLEKAQGPSQTLTLLPQRWIRYALIASAGVVPALIAFWGLTDDSLDSHECLVSVTAREMVRSGNYVVPTMNGKPRLKKPPLSYWLVAGVSRVTGQCDEWAARLPSAVAGSFSALAILYFVSRWTSLRTGVLSVCAWVTSVAYMEWSHNARAEMLMTFFCTVCLLAFFDIQRYQAPRRRRIVVALFWLSFAGANLAKGPIPLPVVFLPILAYVLLRKKKRLLGRLHLVAGLLLMLVIVLPWPVMIAAHLNWDLTLWKNEVFSRFAGQYGSRNRPFYYYLLGMFEYVTPWVVILPMALLSPFYRVWGRRRPLMLYLWLWFAVGLLFFTLSQSKRPHYILPQMPAAAILIGIVLDDLAFERKAFSKRFAGRIVTLHGVALLAAALAGVVYMMMNRHKFPRPMILASVDIVLFIALLTYLLRIASRRAQWAVPCFITILAVIELFGISVYDVGFDSYKDTRQFAREIRERVPPNEPLYVYGALSYVFVHYYGQSLPVLDTAEAVQAHYLQNHWVLVLRADLPEQCRQTCEVVYAQEKRPTRRHDIYGYLLHAQALGGASDGRRSYPGTVPQELTGRI